ncbi:MAG: LCP family protein [Anaerolineaceae bacterium]|nr:LCP family protein [Anaerolineaceae bacterium]
MKKKTLVAVAIALLVVLIIVGGLVFANIWTKPLGKALGLPTRTPFQKSQQIISTSPLPTQTLQGTELPKITELPTVSVPTQVFTPTPKQPVCGSDVPVLYFLVAGADATDPEFRFGLSDVMRIVRIDFMQPKVSVLTLPRDLWVTYPNIKNEPQRCPVEGKLNQAFFFGNPGKACYAGSGEGPGLLAETIASNFDLYADHYVAINETVFKSLIDAMGGVDLYLENAVDGRPLDETGEATKENSHGYFPVGWNHLTGYDAMSFVRIRDRYTEVIRTDHQSLLLCAMKDKMASPEIITKIPKMISALINETQTDLSPAQISQYLTCLLPKLGGSNLQFTRFPDEWFDKNHRTLKEGTFVWDIPQEDIKAYLQKFQADEIPVQSVDESSKPCPKPPAKN